MPDIDPIVFPARLDISKDNTGQPQPDLKGYSDDRR
jgi:hypothetical protein